MTDLASSSFSGLQTCVLPWRELTLRTKKQVQPGSGTRDSANDFGNLTMTAPATLYMLGVKVAYHRRDCSVSFALKVYLRTSCKEGSTDLVALQDVPTVNWPYSIHKGSYLKMTKMYCCCSRHDSRFRFFLFLVNLWWHMDSVKLSYREFDPEGDPLRILYMKGIYRAILS